MIGDQDRDGLLIWTMKHMSLDHILLMVAGAFAFDAMIDHLNVCYCSFYFFVFILMRFVPPFFLLSPSDFVRLEAFVFLVCVYLFYSQRYLVTLTDTC